MAIDSETKPDLPLNEDPEILAIRKAGRNIRLDLAASALGRVYNNRASDLAYIDQFGRAEEHAGEIQSGAQRQVVQIVKDGAEDDFTYQEVVNRYYEQNP